MCLESIRKCTYIPVNKVIIDNGSNNEVKQYLESQGDIIYIRKGRMTFAQAINEGIKATNSKYVCFLNDDTIVSKNWLENMLKSCKNSMVGVFSNCDKGWLHNESINIDRIDLLPGQNTIYQINQIIPQIYDYKHSGNDKEQPWIAFYCTLMERDLINKIGLLDDKFINSGEDVDYCYRAKKMGYNIVQCYNSFVFHFGAAGRKVLEAENKEKYQNEQNFTNFYLNDKWKQPNVVIYTGPSWEKWDFRNVDIGGIGGSETWAVMLSREFSKMGYRVKVFTDCYESGIKDGNI